jgi:hypothetical protein
MSVGSVSATKRSIKQGRPVYDITIHLMVTDEERQKWCVNCRYGLFRSKHRVVAVIEDTEDESPILTTPISLVCPSCSTRYHIQTIV